MERTNLQRLSWVLAAVIGLLAPAWAQQTGDPNFRFEHAHPAYSPGAGPRVCIDEAHDNFHTAGGRYKPFAELLRGDGYEVVPFGEKVSRERLADCRLLVIANPLAQMNLEDWSYPHPSAFTRDELRELALWVREGGRLLLFADHAPIAGAAADLGAVFGVMMLDAYVDAVPGQPDDFRTADGTLRPHAILAGRDETERIDSVRTFLGQGFHITEKWQPLLVLGPGAVARISATQTFDPEAAAQSPSFSVAGLSHGAARVWDKGRAVFLGEAAMCSAQVSGPNQAPFGMNDPEARQNPQFCLNVVHWLDGVLE